MQTRQDINVSKIDHTAPQYQQVWDLREEMLRKPIGLSLKNEDLSRDKEDAIFIAEHDGKVIGCVMGRHTDEGLQLRQMAVYDEWQGKGIGRMLVLALEAYAAQNGYTRILLHARKVARGFYAGMGYTDYGDEFTEVGIAHFMMEKAVPQH